MRYSTGSTIVTGVKCVLLRLRSLSSVEKVSVCRTVPEWSLVGSGIDRVR